MDADTLVEVPQEKATRLFYDRYLVFVTVFAVMEYLQFMAGQPLEALAVDISFFIICLFVLHILEIESLPTVFLIVYELTETISWMYTENGITFRILGAIDLNYAVQIAPQAVVSCVVLFIVVVGSSYLRYGRKTVVVKRRIAFITGLLSFVLFFSFANNKYDVLFPFRGGGPTTAEMQSSFHRIRSYFGGNATVSQSPEKRRNLIMLEVESLEARAIGKFNPRYPLSTPWLSNLTREYSYFSHVKSQPYTTWSAASLFLTQCGLPMVQNDVHWDVRKDGTFDAYKSIECLPNLLKKLGYKLYAFCSGSCQIMNMKSFMIERKYITQDETDHYMKGDEQFFDYLGGTFLEALKRKKEPFVLLILNEDTHFTDFKLAPNCDDSLEEKGYPLSLRSFTCEDQLLHKFLERIKKLGLDENTEVILFGDHLTMGSNVEEFGRQSERNLSIFFPLRRQDELWEMGRNKKITFYDIPPTILDLLGVEYKPRFPFGATMFGPDVGTAPTIDEFKMIYGIITGDSAYGDVQCLGQAGFCAGEEY